MSSVVASAPHSQYTPVMRIRLMYSRMTATLELASTASTRYVA